MATNELKSFAMSDQICIPDSRPASVADCDIRLAQAQRALKLSPNDADLLMATADLFVERFQLQTRESMSAKKFIDQEIDAATSLAAIHRRISEQSDDAEQARQRLLKLPTVQQDLRSAYDHALRARAASPLLPRAQFRLAQLSRLFGDDENDSIDRAARLSRSDSETTFKLGVLQLNRGNKEKAIQLWARSLEVSKAQLEPVLMAAIGSVPVEAIANDILPADPDMLVFTASHIGATPEEIRLRIAVAHRTIRLVEKSDNSEDPNNQYALARANLLLARNQVAASHMRQAVTGRPNDLDWRYECAVLLFETGHQEEARKHLSWCLRLKPNVYRFRQLMQEIDLALQTASR